MKKAVLFSLFFFVRLLTIYAAGVSEEEIDAEYATKNYADRSEWLYEFNRMANKVHSDGLEVIKYAGGQYSGILNAAIMNFDSNSYRYKVLLDLGIKYSFVDEETRQRQIAKLREERDKVSTALSQASGLGL